MTQHSYCAEHVRRFDKDRFICSLFAPSDQREAMNAVYAFNIEVARIREVVSEAMLMQIRLQWWRDAVDAIYGNQAPNHQVVLGLAAAVERFKLDRAYLDRVLRARRFDLEDEPPKDLDVLVEYARDTSGALAQLFVGILCHNAESVTVNAARDVGIAWALTGIIRAVPFHARSRRIYLPADLSREANLDVSELFECKKAVGLSNVVAKIADAANEHLASARLHRSEIPRAALPALLPATLTDAYLAELVKNDFDPFAIARRADSPLRLLKVAIANMRGAF